MIRLYRTLLVLLLSLCNGFTQGLTWTDPNTPGSITHYNVYRNNGDVWDKVSTVQVPYVPLGVFPLGASTAAVTAANPAAESDRSEPLTFSVPLFLDSTGPPSAVPFTREDFDRWFADTHIVDAYEKAFQAAAWGRNWRPPPPPVTALKLAILVADDIVDLPGFQAWYQELQREAKWALFRSEWPAMVGWNDARRLTQLRFQMDWVESTNPDCVVVVGNLPRVAAGYESVDGHAARCEWTFLHLSGHVAFTEYTDVVNHGVAGGGWLTNMAGDGRFDTLNPLGRVRKRPVFAIDAAFPYINTNHTSSGYQIWPQRTERQVLQWYFDRNLEYRRGNLTLPKEVYMHGSATLLWSEFRRSRIQAEADRLGIPFVFDERGNNRFGRLTRWVYSGSEPYLWHLDGPDARTVVHVLWKSYGGSRLHPGGSVHYALERAALVSVWGNDWLPGGPTAYDFFKKNRANLKVHFSDSIYGDPTLVVE